MALPSPRPSPRHGRFHRTETQPPLPGDEGITGADQLQRPPGIRNTKPSPPFIYLVRLFQKLRDCKAQDRKNILSNWFNVSHCIITPTLSNPLFLTFSYGAKMWATIYTLQWDWYFRMWVYNLSNQHDILLNSSWQKDRERATYGLKEANLARSYIAALGLEKNSADAVRLVKWKQPTRDTSVSDHDCHIWDIADLKIFGSGHRRRFSYCCIWGGKCKVVSRAGNSHSRWTEQFSGCDVYGHARVSTSS